MDSALEVVIWTDAPEYVVVHPQDSRMLKGLRTADNVAPELTMEGAYRRRQIPTDGAGHGVTNYATRCTPRLNWTGGWSQG